MGYLLPEAREHDGSLYVPEPPAELANRIQ